MTIVFYENKFVQEEEARIPISDRGFQFGDGAYATLQVRDGTPFFVEEHLEQLERQCRTFNLTMKAIHGETIEELIKLNEAYLGIWRLKIFITGGDSLEPRLPEREGRILMLLKPFSPQPFRHLKMQIFPIPYSSCHASFKSLAHLNRFYVMEEAHRHHVDDCVTVTEKEYLLEASFGNLFWVIEKQLMTPDPALPLYFGITIKTILKMAQRLGFEIQFVKIPVKDLPTAATAFRTNSMQGVRPIAQIGEVTFKNNPTIESLFLNGYEQIIQEQKIAFSSSRFCGNR